MYLILILVLLATGAGLFATGVSTGRRGRAALGAGLFLLTMLFFAFLSFWGEHLWFAELGYSDRFWTVVLAKVGLGLAGAVFGGVVVFLLTQRPASRFVRRMATLLGALLGAGWGVASMSSTTVPRLRGQRSTGPSGVAAQSRAR